MAGLALYEIGEAQPLLFQHPSHLARKRAAVAVGGDGAVHLKGGLHRKDEMMGAQPRARNLLAAVGHAEGKGIIDDVAVSPPDGGVLPQDGKLLAQAILHNGGVAGADLPTDAVG